MAQPPPAGGVGDSGAFDRAIERLLEFGRALLDVGLGPAQVSHRLRIDLLDRTRRAERRLIEGHGRARVAVGRIGIAAPEQFADLYSVGR
jgi:hypothetical protein